VFFRPWLGLWNTPQLKLFYNLCHAGVVSN
jgi:hypothetical protein